MNNLSQPPRLQRLRNRYKGFRRMAALTGSADAARFVLHWCLGKKSVAVHLRKLPHPLTLRTHDSDFDVLLQAFERRECDVSNEIKNPKLIVDVGANVGYTAIFLSTLFPDANVLAIEPEAGNFSVLCENAQFYPRITPIQAALWHRPANLQITNDADRSWTFRVQEGGAVEGSKIRVLTIPELIEKHGRIDILKLDIEGAELPLFSEAPVDWLEEIHGVIIETHGDNCQHAVLQSVGHYNFSTIRRGEKMIFINPHFSAGR